MATHAAHQELALAAEKNTAWIRVAVIAVNVTVYVFFLDHAGTVPWLAFAISAVALVYGLFNDLFQPFTQLHDPSQTNRTGSGLGLYTCRGIIEAHGGRIWAESDGPGRGARFHFEMPLGPAVRSAPAGLHVTVPQPSA